MPLYSITFHDFTIDQHIQFRLSPNIIIRSSLSSPSHQLLTNKLQFRIDQHINASIVNNTRKHKQIHIDIRVIRYSKVVHASKQYKLNQNNELILSSHANNSIKGIESYTGDGSVPPGTLLTITLDPLGI